MNKLEDLIFEVKKNMLLSSDDGFYCELVEAVRDTRIKAYTITRNENNVYNLVMELTTYSFSIALQLCKDIFSFLSFSDFGLFTSSDESQKDFSFSLITASDECVFGVDIFVKNNKTT